MVIGDGSAGAEIVSQATGEVLQVSELKDYLTPVLDVIKEQFPTDDSYVLMAEVAICAYATLMLRMDGCVAIIFEGNPSTNKTTVLDMFDTVDLTYRLDDFTPASFVTMASNVAKKERENIDLLPRIQHKVLVAADLAPLLSKKTADSETLLGIFTRVLDGKGYFRSTGTTEPRGHVGNYRFVLLGATTPMTKQVHEKLAQLGNRLLLSETTNPTMTNDELNDLLSGDIKFKVETCQEVIKHAIESAWEDVGGFEAIVPDDAQEDREILNAVNDLARITALGRSYIDEDQDRVEGLPRTVTRLRGIGQARALLNGRHIMNREDIQMLARIAVGSMPSHRRKLFKCLVQSEEDENVLDTSEVQALFGCDHKTAIVRMEDLGTTGLATAWKEEEYGGWQIMLDPDYQWLTFEDERWLLEKLNK